MSVIILKLKIFTFDGLSKTIRPEQFLVQNHDYQNIRNTNVSAGLIAPTSLHGAVHDCAASAQVKLQRTVAVITTERSRRTCSAL